MRGYTMKIRLSGLARIVIIVSVAVIVIGIVGQTPMLTCTRDEVDKSVNCIKQTRLLWLIPLGEEAIQGVQGAIVADCDSCEGGGYRVELLTAQGNIPFNAVYDGTPSGFQSTSDQAHRINDFVHGTMNSREVVITDPGFFTPLNIGVAMVFSFGYAAWRWLRR
jgi:hypothetical protein